MKLLQGLSRQPDTFRSFSEKVQIWRGQSGKTPGRKWNCAGSWSDIVKPLPGRRLGIFMEALRQYSTAKPHLQASTSVKGLRQLVLSQVKHALQKDMVVKNSAGRLLTTFTSGKSSISSGCEHISGKGSCSSELTLLSTTVSCMRSCCFLASLILTSRAPSPEDTVQSMMASNLCRHRKG
jgi:hypothetical protein